MFKLCTKVRPKDVSEFKSTFECLDDSGDLVGHIKKDADGYLSFEPPAGFRLGIFHLLRLYTILVSMREKEDTWEWPEPTKDGETSKSLTFNSQLANYTSVTLTYTMGI